MFPAERSRIRQSARYDAIRVSSSVDLFKNFISDFVSVWHKVRKTWKKIFTTGKGTNFVTPCILYVTLTLIMAPVKELKHHCISKPTLVKDCILFLSRMVLWNIRRIFLGFTERTYNLWKFYICIGRQNVIIITCFNERKMILILFNF